MKQLNWGTSALAAAVLFGTTCLFAADEAAKPDAAPPAAPAEVTTDAAKPAAAGEAKPAADAEAAADEKPAKPARKLARLTKPWNQITSLSTEQRDEIRAIHRKALDEVKAIQAREKGEIMALLSDAQKAELEAIEEQATVARKTKKPAAKKPAEGEAAKKGEAAEATR